MSGIMTEEQLEDAVADIMQGLAPDGPCTCGSDPERSCQPCGESMRGQAKLDALEKHIAAQASRVAVLEAKLTRAAEALITQGHQVAAMEAMRAACWEAVQKKLHRYGMHNAVEDFQAAIEGAKP